MAATWGRGLWEAPLVGRSTYPRITHTSTVEPPTLTYPAEGTGQYVTSIICHDTTLTSVYVEWSTDSATFGNVIPMYPENDSTWISQTPVPSDTADSKMFFKVFAVGVNGDTTETYKFMYTTRPFDYCMPFYIPGFDFNHIESVSLNGVTNTSAGDTYADFTNVVIPLFLDGYYTLQIGLQQNIGFNALGAWIDFNRDGILSEDERINLTAVNSNNQSLGWFSVPSDAVTESPLRMRVVYGLSLIHI